MLLGHRGYKATQIAVVILTLIGLAVLSGKHKLLRAYRKPEQVFDRHKQEVHVPDVLYHAGPELVQGRGGSYETDQMEGFRLMCLMEAEELPPEYEANPRVAHENPNIGEAGAFGWGQLSDAFEPSDVPQSVRAAFNYMGVPDILDPSWDMVTWSDQFPYPRENPKYTPTRASFKNFFNCEYGALIAITNEGPLHVKNRPPLEKITPLRQWSELMALEWWNRCGPQRPLNFVMRTTVRNGETVRNLGQIYGVPDFKNVPLEESKLGTFAAAKTFDPSSDDLIESEHAHAIIGSPNGRGVAYLLCQHKDLFGSTRQITKIKVWDATEGKANAIVSEGWPNILFELGGSTTPPSTRHKRSIAFRSRFAVEGESQTGSVPATARKSETTQLNRRNIHHRLVDELNTFPAQIKPENGQYQFYNDAVAKGCELNRLMQQVTQDPKYPATGTDYHDIEKAGWQMIDSDSINKNHRYSQDVMQKLKIPPTVHDSWTFIYWKYEKFSKDHINPKSGQGYRTDGYYSNAYNCDAGMIMAISNNNPSKAQENPTLTASDLPILNKWSDINALTWQEACGPTKPLHYLLRSHVHNDETQDVLRLNLGMELTQNKDLGAYPGRRFEPDTREGRALLGSPNGRGGAFMLSQHKSLFGATRQVTRISVWGFTQDPNLLFEFGSSEHDVPSDHVDAGEPYDFTDQPWAELPCFVFPCD